MNAHDFIKKQHREVEKNYDTFTKGNSDQKKELGRKILTDLTVHAEIEEELYYPELSKASANTLANEFRAEHDSMKSLIAELAVMDSQEDDYIPTMKALMDIVRHHIKEEEEGMEKAETLLSAEKLEELGMKMEERSGELHELVLKRLWAAVT